MFCAVPGPKVGLLPASLLQCYSLSQSYGIGPRLLNYGPHFYTLDPIATDVVLVFTARSLAERASAVLPLPRQVVRPSVRDVEVSWSYR